MNHPLSSLHSHVDQIIENGKTWTAKLPFISSITPEQKSSFQVQDILHYLDKTYRNCQCYRIYLPISKYNSTQGFSEDSSDWIRLLTDIKSATCENGFEVFSNGKSNATANDRKITCVRGKCYQRSTNSKKIPLHSTNKENLRQSSISHDRRNSRSNGLSKARRCCTKKSIKGSGRCSFFFLIKYDDLGFYIAPGRGNACHKHHEALPTQQIHVKTNLMQMDDIDLIGNMNSASLSSASASNLLLAKTGQFFGRGQIRYIQGLLNMRPSNTDLGTEIQDVTSTERMIQNIHMSGSSSVYLLHRMVQSTEGKMEATVLSSLKRGSKSLFPVNLPETSSSNNFEGEVLPAESHTGIHEFGILQRHSMNAAPSDDLMMAVGFAHPSEVLEFRRFPYVLKIDCTADTNKENRPLMIVAGRSPSGKSFTAVKVSVPNEQGWVFRWVFCQVLPVLLGQDALARVQVVITDRDSTEIQQLEECLDEFYPRARRLRCAYHVITKGWKTNVGRGDSFVPKQHQMLFQKMSALIQDWIYSWCSETCETLDEFEISKSLLLQLISSQCFLDHFGRHTYDKVLHCVERHIIPHTRHFCFYRRKGVPHFYDYTNNGVEGLNFGLKHSANGVRPNMSMNTSVKNLLFTSLKKKHENEIESGNMKMKTQLWSSLSVGESLVDKAVSLVDQEWREQSGYHSVIDSPNHFLVVRHDSTSETHDNKTTENKGIFPTTVPRFRRVRTLHVNERHELVCSCEHYGTSRGIPCRHQYHVLLKYCNYVEPLKQDIGIVWHKSYATRSFVRDQEDGMAEALEKMESKHIQGPFFDKRQFNSTLHPVIDSNEIPDCFQISDSVINTCVNYSNDLILSAVSKYSSNMTRFVPSFAEAGALLSQTFEQEQDVDTYKDEDSETEPSEDLFNNVVENLQDDKGDEGGIQTAAGPRPVDWYDHLMPKFKQLIPLFRDGAQDEAVRFSKMIDEVHSACRMKLKDTIVNEASEKVSAPASRKRVLSSSLPTSRKKKTHGTKHL